jgi:ELMO domain-containing protein
VVQGDDPSTDFRGAGLFGLENLLYLSDNYPSLFAKLLHKMDGERSDWEYPFAVAGLNLTFMMLEVLDLTGKGSVHAPRTLAGRVFLTLMKDSECAFEEMYCTLFELLDSVWLEMHASYMDFPAVMKATRARFEKAMADKPRTSQQLRQYLFVR